LKRSPTDEEQQRFVAYLRSLSDKGDVTKADQGDTAASSSLPLPVGIDEYAQLIQILLCTNEFCFVD
jgi:hypothetical protein